MTADDVRTDEYKHYTEAPTYTTLVLGGGANRGIMYGGALACLHDQNLLRGIDTYIGSSVGALMCALLAVGYTSDEITGLIMEHHFSHAKPANENELYNIFARYACYSNSQMERVVKKVIAERADIPTLTLGQLHEVYHRTLVITACCVNSRKTEYLSYHTDPDLPIYRAVCMSMTIPFVFEPHTYNDHLYIDGCTFGHSYPVYWPRLDKARMIGFRLCETDCTPVQVVSLVQYVKLIAYGVSSTESCKEHANTITLACDVSTFADEIPADVKTRLINRAYEVVMEWLAP